MGQEHLDDFLLTQLRGLCEQHGITRFSVEEIAELVEDGEDPLWIVEQAAPDGPPAVAAELETLLRGMAGPIADDEDTNAPGPPAASPSPGIDSGDTEGAPAVGQHGSMADFAQAMEGLDLPPGIDRGQLEQLMASPRAALIADFGLFCQEKGVDPEQAQMMGQGADGALQTLQEEWLETPRDALEGKQPKELLEGGRLFPGAPVETYRREEPKVGRNDPCPCGSGKKFKKCCAKG